MYIMYLAIIFLSSLFIFPIPWVLHSRNYSTESYIVSRVVGSIGLLLCLAFLPAAVDSNVTYGEVFDSHRN